MVSSRLGPAPQKTSVVFDSCFSSLSSSHFLPFTHLLYLAARHVLPATPTLASKVYSPFSPVPLLHLKGNHGLEFDSPSSLFPSTLVV